LVRNVTGDNGVLEESYLYVSFVRTIVKERNRRMGECYNRRLLNRCRMGNTQIIGVAAFQGGIGNHKAKSNNSFCEKLHL
jgi:hypothetical protein